MNSPILNIIDWILFALLGAQVIYLFIFALGAKKYHLPRRSINRPYNRFLILIPAYKEDRVIVETVRSAIYQEYPSELFSVVVISDQMSDETNQAIERLGARVLIAHFQNSTKAQALNYAITQLSTDSFHRIVILDADNLISSTFLKEADRFCIPEAIALQAHRTAKNRDSRIALLDGASEEINNTLFRKGHVALGLSSALIGSGMIFETQWFVRHVTSLQSTGEDKELETMLLKEQIHIEYLDTIEVYDEKINKSSNFYHQRRRWMASQTETFARSLHALPSALWNFNWDYLNKNFQWVLLPRLLLWGIIAVIGITLLLLTPTSAIKWLLLLGINSYTLWTAIPGKQRTPQLLRAALSLPWLFILMGSNLFRLRGANKQFIHTEKGESA